MTATVNDQSITITDESLTVSESVGIYECDFTFDASWDEWNKTAVFEGAGETIEMIVVDNKAQIPREVLKEAGWIKIGVYGTKGGEIKPTIWSDQIYVAAGTVPGSVIVTPTPSIYAQILDLANDAKDIAEDAQDTADDVASDWASVSATATTLSAGSPATVTFADNTFAFGIPKGAKGDTGATGATGATPDFSIGTVSTLETGQPATATITGTAAQPVLNLGLPKGNKGDNGDVANIADAYSTSATYAVGDYCIYNSQLYRCTTAITTAEAWTAAHWTAVQLGDDTSTLRSALINKAEKSITLTQIPFTITKNKHLDPNGNEVSRNYYALLTADLTGISGSLRICSYIGYNNAKYAFYDANDTVIAKGNRSGTEDAFVDDVQIPSGATKVKVSGRTINVVAIPKVCHLAYVDEMNNINGGEFTSLLVPNAFADIAYSWSSGGFVYNNNSFVKSDSVQFMEINVAEGEFYRITGENYYSFNIIGYANNNNASNITWIPNASNKKSIDMVLQIPKGIDCLIVQRDALKTTTIKKATGYADGRIFLGKKIAIIGDSTVEKNATATMKWHDNIALETGLEVVNLGVSGTGYKSGEGSNRAYYQRLSDVPSDCDAVVIFGSGNDNAQTIGTITDTTTDTVCGCVNKTINDLISLYPTIKIGVITAYPWRSFKPSTANAMQTIANDIVEICKGNSIPVLDLYHCSNLRPWIEENDEALFANADGCHINDVGHAIITPMILEFIKTLLTSY